MPKKKNTLSNKEIKLLCILADGKTYAQARTSFQPPLSLANVYVTCHTLRQKTGIQQTRDQWECKRYVAKLDQQRIADAMSPIRSTTGPLTDNQLDVFRLMALGRTYTAIALLLGIRKQSVQNLASRACKRAGIIHGGWNRTRYITEWLQRNDPNLPASLTPLPKDPMDDPMF